jgi:YHS domain-containing protein
MFEVVFYVVLLLFLGRAALSLWGGIKEGLRGPAGSGGGVPSRGVQMVRDPVCGTFVVPDRAIALTVGRDHLYFCSTACRDKYRSRPDARTERVEGRTA